jgi:hypothetical protein
VIEAEVQLAEAYAVTAYPNPFRGQARVEVAVREAQQVTVEVYDVLGRRVARLFDGAVAASQTEALAFSASGLGSGLYVVRVTGETFRATRRLTLVR